MDLPAFARPADRSARFQPAIEMPSPIPPQGQQFEAPKMIDDTARNDDRA
jgi:hypothetical protein